jgi:hypothetical protein
MLRFLVWVFVFDTRLERWVRDLVMELGSRCRRHCCLAPMPAIPVPNCLSALRLVTAWLCVIGQFSEFVIDRLAVALLIKLASIPCYRKLASRLQELWRVSIAQLPVCLGAGKVPAWGSIASVAGALVQRMDLVVNVREQRLNRWHVRFVSACLVRKQDIDWAPSSASSPTMENWLSWLLSQSLTEAGLTPAASASSACKTCSCKTPFSDLGVY